MLSLVQDDVVRALLTAPVNRQLPLQACLQEHVFLLSQLSRSARLCCRCCTAADGGIAAVARAADAGQKSVLLLRRRSRAASRCCGAIINFSTAAAGTTRRHAATSGCRFPGCRKVSISSGCRSRAALAVA